MSVRTFCFSIYFHLLFLFFMLAKYGDSLKDQKVKKGTGSFGKPRKRGKDFISLGWEIVLYFLFFKTASHVHVSISWREEQYRYDHMLVIIKPCWIVTLQPDFCALCFRCNWKRLAVHLTQRNGNSKTRGPVVHGMLKQEVHDVPIIQFIYLCSRDVTAYKFIIWSEQIPNEYRYR